MAQHALHVGQDTRADKSGKGVGDEVTAEENGIALGEFAARVPFGQNQQRTRQESRLDETKEESNGDHACEIVHASTKSGNKTPEQHSRRNVQRRTLDAVDEHVGGHLHEDVPDVQNTQAGGVLVVAQVEVFLQALETGGGHVIAVEVVHDVDEDEEGAAGVELALHALFDGGAMLGVHCEGNSCRAAGLRLDACFGRGHVVVWLLVCHGIGWAGGRAREMGCSIWSGHRRIYEQTECHVTSSRRLVWCSVQRRKRKK